MEAFSSLREDFQKSLQKLKQLEVDQISSSAHKPNPFSKNLDKPSKSSGSAVDGRLNMVQSCLLASTPMIVASRTPGVIFIVQPRNPQGLPRPGLNNLHMLLDITMWIRALPWTTSLITRMTLNRPLLHLKSTLISQNTNRGPDSYPHLQA